MRGEELFGKGASDYVIEGGGVRALGGDRRGRGGIRGEGKKRGEEGGREGDHGPQVSQRD